MIQVNRDLDPRVCFASWIKIWIVGFDRLDLDPVPLHSIEIMNTKRFYRGCPRIQVFTSDPVFFIRFFLTSRSCSFSKECPVKIRIDPQPCIQCNNLTGLIV